MPKRVEKYKTTILDGRSRTLTGAIKSVPPKLHCLCGDYIGLERIQGRALCQLCYKFKNSSNGKATYLKRKTNVAAKTSGSVISTSVGETTKWNSVSGMPLR